MRNSKSLIAFIFCCLFIASVSFAVKKWNEWGSQSLFSWDISGYYLYLPGFFYDDLGELHKRQYIIDTYHPCGGNDIYAYRCSTGKYIIKYSSGMAVMYLPGFTVGHFWAKWGGYPVDGFSYPYQFSMAMYSLLVSFLGLWFIRKVLLGYFSDGIVAIGLLILCLATNYLNYSAIGNMFSHNYLFTLYVLILYLTERWYRKPDYSKTLGLGILCGLAALSRPTEVICVILPLLWGVYNMASIRNRLQVLVREYKLLLLFSACVFFIGAIQFIYWKVYAGHFIHWSYGEEEGFDFLRVHVLSCLFSYKKGWFAYTPVMILAFIGFVPLYIYQRSIFYAALVFSFIALYITFAWKNWAYGGSFSMRAVIQYYAVLIFPFCSFLSFSFKKWITKIPVILFLCFCTWLNLLMTYQANIAGIMESSNMTKPYYWKIFGRTTVEPSARKLIECEEEVPATLESGLTEVSRDVFCVDSPMLCTMWKGRKAVRLDSVRQFAPETSIDISHHKNSWYRGYADVYIEGWEDEYWNHARIYFWLINEQGAIIKNNNYRLHLIVPHQTWKTISLDILIPQDTKGRTLKFGIYNSESKKEIYVGNIRIESVKL